METLLTIIHVVASFILIFAVLLQAGRGGGMGAALGGASQQVFGGRGASNFLTKITTSCAVIFMATSLALSWTSSRQRSVFENVPAAEATDAEPAAGTMGTDAEASDSDNAGTTPAPSENVEGVSAEGIAPEGETVVTPTAEDAPAKEDTPAEAPSTDEAKQ
jgi:preprotein translocase subunit SecG